MAGLEISPAAHRCYDSLSSLAQEFERSRNKWEYELKERDLAQLFERFEQWAENLGALRQLSSKLSLDHRLRDSPTVRASIFSMLEDLNESAKMATEIVSGGRPNRVMPTLDITEEELEEFDISSSSSESGASITSNSSRDSRHDKPSEIQKLLSAIRTSLNSLFKASVFIRKFAAEDRRQRASKTKPFVNTADLMYIKDKYSFLWETNEPLAIRLAEANARRRQYFKYRQQHQEKLSSQLDDSLIGRRDAHLRTEPKPLDGEPLRQGSIVSGMTKPSILAETEATEFVRNKASEAQLFAISSPEPAMSVFSMATTVVEASDTELQFPPIPQEGQKSDSFLCPYCLEIVLWQTKNKEMQWRKHIIHDLEPYLCLDQTCTLDTFSSAYTWFEHELLVHRTIWECPLCANTVQGFEDMREHMHSYHGSNVVASQHPSLISQCRRPARQILASDCPFCDDQWATVEPHAESPAQSDTEDEYENADVHVDTDSFRRHVGHHLVQLSLFSLPRLYTGEVGDLNSAGAVPDGERYSQKGTAFRLGQDHLSRGWKVLIKRMGTLATISLFLGLYDKQRRGNVYPDELAIVTFESLPPSHKDRGDGWFIVHNPTIPKMFDLTLLHTGKLDHPVTDVCFSLQGHYVGICSNRMFQVLNTGTEEPICSLHSEEIVGLSVEGGDGDMYYRDACFHPNDDLFITCSEDRLIRVLDIESRSVIQTLVGHTDDVYKVDISKNGKLLASGSGDRTVRLWSTTTWEFLHLIRLPDGVTGVAFSNQNDYLIASTLGTIARVWKPDTIPNVEEPFEQDQTQANIWTCSGHSDSIYDVRFSSDDKYVITASLDESAKVFPAVSQRCDDSSKSLKCLSTLEGHSDYVLSVEVMSNGWVVTASKDRSVRFWDMETGRSIARLNAHSNSVIATAITPSTGTGFMFATASGDLKWRLWSLSLTRPVDSMLPG
ncbi:WD40-repeat-containing domain protein [Colletotrichum acutatum]|uniref:WD40-repeat-containing domain protein n=1 Tax=Glomerella acutata TaxID=27357 RepID=A0AAD8UBH0_GLOAC|nr:WD40-repeat-containing domain protein [Colletotrichum acutatum]KAK1708896.1 WD40-repeat-containing domain protein [Colletotrichum acutatum]